MRQLIATTFTVLGFLLAVCGGAKAGDGVHIVQEASVGSLCIHPCPYDIGIQIRNCYCTAESEQDDHE